MGVVIAALDLFGAVVFFAGTALAVQFYRNRPVYRNYWLSWILVALHFGLWSVVEFVGAIGVLPAISDGVLPVFLLAVGLTALFHIAVYDNTGSKALLERLKTSEERNSTIIEQFPEGGVVLFDERLTILLAGGEDLFDREGSPAEMAGAALSTALPEGAGSKIERACRGALAGERGAFEVGHGDSTYQVRTLPAATADVDRAEGILVVQNVTERERRERLLREQRDELATLDRINGAIRDVDRALVGSTDRAEIERAVAERLADDEPYRSVLVASLAGNRRLVASAWGGDAADWPADGVPADAGPSARAIEAREPQVLRNVADEGDANDDTRDDPWRQSARDVGASELAVVPIRYGDRDFGVIAAYADRPDAFDDRELAVLDQFGETVGYAITAIERRERADLLAGLHRATRDLLHAETPEAVGEVVVGVGTDLLDVEIGVFEYDDAEGQLAPLTASDGALDFYEESPMDRADPGSITWRTFTSGEQRVFDDVRTAEALSNPETDARSAIFVPLGDHGVLVAGSTEIGAFDGDTQRLIELLAATTEAAFDRVESEADLREREAELQERNRALERLQRVNDVIRDVDQGLIGASSRAEIEHTVCDRLTTDDRFRFAWIGGSTSDDTSPSPRAWAGEGMDYLARASFDPEAEVPEPAARTLAGGEPTVVANLADHVRRADWVSRALDHGFASVVSVPIVYRDIEYGQLTVYASGPNEFDEETAAVLAELAETVAHAINARETERGLLATGGTELKLRLRDGPSFLNDVAALAEAPVRVVETRPGGTGSAEVYFATQGLSLSALEERCHDLVGVDEVAAVSDRGDEGVFRATVSGTTLADAVVEAGAIPREIEASADETTLVAAVLPHVDAGEFVDRLRERFGTVELLARRERDTEAMTRGAFLDEFESHVTDRQLEVLHEAYEQGYFESPREVSGQGLADRLGVSQPTVNYHLRVSQRRLLALLFGERDEPPAEERA